MEKKKLFCVTCDEKREYTLKPVDITHEIKGEPITIKNVEIPYCSVCKNQLNDLDIEEGHFELALNQYRREKNLLMPEKIKGIRKKYDLSQRAFGRALGFAESTINRYELGALQDSTHNSILLLVKEPKNFLLVATQNQDKLSEAELKHIKIKVEVSLKEEVEMLELVDRGKLVIESDALKRLELMVLGLSKSVDNIEKIFAV